MPQPHQRPTIALLCLSLTGILALTGLWSPVAPACADTTTDLQPAAFLPLVANNTCVPSITFTTVPPAGSYDDLQGRVTCVDPAAYSVAVYIGTGGWWNKPTWASPLTPIASDGTWTTDITTGPGDPDATRLAAFVVPTGYDPPQLAGPPTLPQELYDVAISHTMVTRAPNLRAIVFAGRTWYVKASDSPVGPGPNLFSDREDSVWVDDSGHLHLRIAQHDGQWTCAEVYSADPVGYGTYTFTLAGPVDQLDKNMVLGLFTWDGTAPDVNYREIDIEFSRWGQDLADNAQFVVQPYTSAGNLHRFNAVLTGTTSTHAFTWTPDTVRFAAYQGHASTSSTIDTWTYTGADVPPAGDAHIHLNLWLVEGIAPANATDAEVILTDVSYVPSSQAHGLRNSLQSRYEVAPAAAIAGAPRNQVASPGNTQYTHQGCAPADSPAPCELGQCPRAHSTDTSRAD